MQNPSYDRIGPLLDQEKSVRICAGHKSETTDINVKVDKLSATGTRMPCTFVAVENGVQGPFSYTWYKAYPFGEWDGHYYFSEMGVSLVVVLADSTLACPVSKCIGIADGLLGQIATFAEETPNKPATATAEVHTQVNYDYQEIWSGDYYNGRAMTQEQARDIPYYMPVGKPHAFILSIPSSSFGPKIALDAIDVRSFSPYERYTSWYSGDERTDINPFNLADESVGSVKVATALREAPSWKNFRTADVFLPNLVSKGEGLYLVAVTLANGAQAWARAPKPDDFEFEKSTLFLFGAVARKPMAGRTNKMVWDVRLKDSKRQVI